MDDTLTKILAGSGSAAGIIILLFFFLRYLVGQLKELRQSSSQQASLDREIYLKSHEQTVGLTREIAIDTQAHLADCHKENRELSSRLGKLEVRYADLSAHIIRGSPYDPRTSDL